MLQTEFLTNLPAGSVDEAKVAAREMLRSGPQTAIITLGPKGCVVGTRNGDEEALQHVPCPQVTAIDTTVDFFANF